MHSGIRATVAAVALATVTLASSALAQNNGFSGGFSEGFYGQGHAGNHDWYSKLNQPGTRYSCCNGDEHGGDCRPTRAFLGEDGYWHAQIDGNWATVPSRAVLDRLAPDGNSHICASKGGYIFCFIGGSPKS